MTAERKKREKAQQRRATESANRLQRAKDAEAEVKALEAQIDELHERLQHAALRREASDDEEEAYEEASRRREAGRSSDGRRLAPFAWTTRRLFHRWLARSTPPATAGANYSDAANNFSPHEK
eukprot:6545350-Prymnesium_polylepis.1